jgi:hypothetical protein
MTERKAHAQLEQLPQYPESAYTAIDLNRLASFTVHCLQQQRIPTTFENIVVAAFRMFPAKFALEGYLEYPDAARVNRALLQLRPKYRNWARGNVQKGFVLTESGLAEVNRVNQLLSSPTPSGTVEKRRRLKPRTMDLSRDLGSIMDSSLFAKWRDNRLNEGTVLELIDMLQAFVYTPPHALKQRVDGLENAALQVGREDLANFLKDVRRTFDPQFRPTKGG